MPNCYWLIMRLTLLTRPFGLRMRTLCPLLLSFVHVFITNFYVYFIDCKYNVRQIQYYNTPKACCRVVAIKENSLLFQELNVSELT